MIVAMQIWYADIRQLEQWEGFERAKDCLSEERKRKLEKYKKKADVLRSAGAGFLLEYGLRTYGLSEKEVKFSYVENGKPVLMDHPELYFNLTHSGDYVAAVFSDTESGIDIEQIQTGKHKVVERFFSEEEKSLFEKNWSDDLFTKIWTRKESFIKAVGIGMRLPLDSFSTVGEMVTFLETENGRNEENVPYFLKSFECIAGYGFSVCTRKKRADAEPEKVDLTEFF